MDDDAALRKLVQQRKLHPFHTPEPRRITEGIDQLDVLLMVRPDLRDALTGLKKDEPLVEGGELVAGDFTGQADLAFHAADDFDEARSIMDSTETDLACVEACPPGEDDPIGINLCNILRQSQDPEQYYPIIVVEESGRSPEAIRHDLLVSGADAYCFAQEPEVFVPNWFTTLQVVLRVRFLFQESFATQAQLSEDRNVDPTTGVYNRRKFQSDAQKIVSNFFSDRRMKGDIIMGFFDINNMKAVNDRLGHKKGDEVLKKFADVLTQQTRSEKDYIFRWGGDEFIVLYRDLTPEQAESSCERIRDTFHTVIDDFDFDLSVSWGKTVIENSMEDLDDVIKRCDQKLQAMKERTSGSERRDG